MKIVNVKIIDYINQIIEEWNENYDLNLPNIPEGQDLSFYNQDVSFEFKHKITSIKDYPTAYESTDEGAQGRTTFKVIDDILIEVYDAMDNYATITIYLL